MSTRTTRLRLLATELKGSIEALAGETTSLASILFLDRLARCEQFDPEELGASGAGELVVLARAARESEGAALADWAGSELQPGAIGDRGEVLAEAGSPEEVSAWAEDLLLIATLLPWLPATMQPQASDVLDRCRATIEAAPSAFAPVARLADDRRRCEGPAFGEALAAVLGSFEKVAAPAPGDARGPP